MNKKLSLKDIKAVQAHHRELFQLIGDRVGNQAAWCVEVSLWHHNYLRLTESEEMPYYSVTIFSKDGHLDKDDAFKCTVDREEKYGQLVGQLTDFLDTYYQKK